jgi:3D (Asp-Asp-Asp) domain-containing protein
LKISFAVALSILSIGLLVLSVITEENPDTLSSFFAQKENNIAKKEEVLDRINVLATPYYVPERNQSRFINGSYKKEIRMNGTGITFTGTTPRVGTIAADPKFLPFGTVIRIPDYGIGIVEDIGSRIRGRHIDLFMGFGESGLERCIDFGKKQLGIEVLKWGG